MNFNLELCKKSTASVHSDAWNRVQIENHSRKVNICVSSPHPSHHMAKIIIVWNIAEAFLVLIERKNLRILCRERIKTWQRSEKSWDDKFYCSVKKNIRISEKITKPDKEEFEVTQNVFSVAWKTPPRNKKCVEIGHRLRFRISRWGGFSCKPAPLVEVKHSTETAVI